MPKNITISEDYLKNNVFIQLLDGTKISIKQYLKSQLIEILEEVLGDGREK